MSIPPRTKAVLVLDLVISRYIGRTGPGKWTVDKSERNFVALTWSCPSARLPANPNSEDVWDLCSGWEILVASGLKKDRFVSGNDGEGNFFTSAIIYVRD
jgi:hypothetical protein